MTVRITGTHFVLCLCLGFFSEKDKKKRTLASPQKIRQQIHDVIKNQGLDMNSVNYEKDQTQRRALRDTPSNRISGEFVVLSHSVMLSVNKV